MATFADWSATASANTTIASINIDEGCPSANINNAIRELMAACKTFDTGKADGSLYVLKSASILSAGFTVTGGGAGLHHNNAANASGKIFVQATGGAVPTMADGDFLFEY